MTLLRLFGFAIIIFIAGCQQHQHVDSILINGIFHNPTEPEKTFSVLVINDGKIVATGDSVLIQSYAADTLINLEGHHVYPGFNDAHAHFYGLGMTSMQVDLTGTNSWEEVIRRCIDFTSSRNLSVLRGRGWDQNDWKNNSYPDNSELNKHFPKIPVLLKRVDGHAAIANDAALALAGIEAQTTISGGEILRKDGKPTGILIDNAVDLVQDKLAHPDHLQIVDALLKAQQICLSYGLTSMTDAGLDTDIILLIDSLQRAGKLKIRIDAMVSATPQNLDYWIERGPLKTNQLTVHSFKMYADGSLGSRGACMKQSYNDLPYHTGFLLTPPDQISAMVNQVASSSFQLNTHCIGDSANHLMLMRYASVLPKDNDRRWRIEHAQVVDPADIHYFKDYAIIPSVQPVHATSDMYWAGDRIGPARMAGAYALKTLLNQNMLLPLGTDCPVESPNPFHNFYAAVERKDASGFPPEGFQMKDALTREEALKGMTIWPAYASFCEQEKGAFAVGMYADLVVLENDLLHDNLKVIRKSLPLQVYINGERMTIGR